VSDEHARDPRDELRHAQGAADRRVVRPTARDGRLALFLAGGTSTFLFGQILSDDGGWS
jgi:hypothetical protein